jgi:hypothetical protein
MGGLDDGEVLGGNDFDGGFHVMCLELGHMSPDAAWTGGVVERRKGIVVGVNCWGELDCEWSRSRWWEWEYCG